MIDGATMEVVAEVPTGAGPHGVAVDAAGTTAWVTNAFDDTVTVVDLESFEVVRTVEVGDAPNGISVGEALLPHRTHARLLMPHPYAPQDGHSHSHGDPEDSDQQSHHH